MALDSSDMYDWQDDVEGLVVLDGEFVTVTREGADHPVFQHVAALLGRLYKALSLDVVFACQIAGESLLLREAKAETQAESIAAEHADALEAAYCRRVLEDRLWASDARHPAARRVFLALPVVGKDGFDYGTVSCRVGGAPGGAADQAQALHAIARLVALALSAREARKPVDVWQSSAAAALDALPPGR